jgi:hypothetical protein
LFIFIVSGPRAFFMMLARMALAICRKPSYKVEAAMSMRSRSMMAAHELIHVSHETRHVFSKVHTIDISFKFPHVWKTTLSKWVHVTKFFSNFSKVLS